MKSLYDIWAPVESIWTPWAKAVVFSASRQVAEAATPPSSTPGLAFDSSFASADTAVVVDLPGAQSVEVGIELLRHGFRPVPLFNAVPFPSQEEDFNELARPAVDMNPVLDALRSFAPVVLETTLSPTAPPAFLLDSRRRGSFDRPDIGMFDNRSVCFVSDFPSARFLAEAGITRVLLIHEAGLNPEADLRQVLRSWQDKGIELFLQTTNPPSGPGPFQVRKPSWFSSLWQRATIAMGLRPNPLGGFGGMLYDTHASG